MADSDQKARYRERRRRRRRQVRRRRAVALAVLLGLVGAIALGARTVSGGHDGRSASAGAKRSSTSKPTPRPVPDEIRGVHVTMELASLPGKLDEYLGLSGLNTIEVDVKDENGHVGFVPRSVPLARRASAAVQYYNPERVARRVHALGVYLIGRVVVFEDPVLAERRPDLAVQTIDGAVWHNAAGLGWTNPYDRRVWRYNVDLAVAAAQSGFDEIQFDYVRFPSDGDLSLIRYPGTQPQSMRWTIPAFVHYASNRLHPLGTRVSVDLFGLSATRDLGIGQLPQRVSRNADAVYPMVYPSHFNPGEYGIDDPNAWPGPVVSRSLSDFRQSLEGRKVRLTPWLQDFSLGRTYTIDDVRLQIAAARGMGTNGFLLWNPEGVYSSGALQP
jgi:hypothetical protein